MGYDWTPVKSPVNQVPYLEGYTKAHPTADDDDGNPLPDGYQPGYFEHICRFAHDLSLLPANTLQLVDNDLLEPHPAHPHDDDSAKKWALLLKLTRAQIGFVFNELETWSKLPNTPTAQTPAHQNWRTRRTSYIQHLMNWICWQCPHPFWARDVLLEMTPSLYETAMASDVADIESGGNTYRRYTTRLPRIDFTTKQPKTGTGSGSIFTSVSGAQNPDETWKGWIAGYKKAIQRYGDRYAKHY